MKSIDVLRKNDIVVCVKAHKYGHSSINDSKVGDIKKVYCAGSTDVWWMSDGEGNSPIECFRLASKEEIKAYNKGLTNISQIEQIINNYEIY